MPYFSYVCLCKEYCYVLERCASYCAILVCWILLPPSETPTMRSFELYRGKPDVSPIILRFSLTNLITGGLGKPLL